MVWGNLARCMPVCDTLCSMGLESLPPFTMNLTQVQVNIVHTWSIWDLDMTGVWLHRRISREDDCFTGNVHQFEVGCHFRYGVLVDNDHFFQTLDTKTFISSPWEGLLPIARRISVTYSYQHFAVPMKTQGMLNWHPEMELFGTQNGRSSYVIIWKTTLEMRSEFAAHSEHWGDLNGFGVSKICWNSKAEIRNFAHWVPLGISEDGWNCFRFSTSFTTKTLAIRSRFRDPFWGWWISVTRTRSKGWNPGLQLWF